MTNEPTTRMARCVAFIWPVFLTALMGIGVINTAVVLRLLTGHPEWVACIWGFILIPAMRSVWVGVYRPNHAAITGHAPEGESNDR